MSEQADVSTFKFSQIPPPGTGGDVVNLPKTEVDTDVAMGVDDAVKDTAEAAGGVDAEARQYLAQQTQEVVVPSYAAWFSFGTIRLSLTTEAAENAENKEFIHLDPRRSR